MDIQLTEPKLKGTKFIEECIFERKSIRKYDDKEIEIEKISQILWAGQGKKGIKRYTRTVPSAGATYPLELRVILKNKGLFRFDIERNTLEMEIEGKICEDLARASWKQLFICDSPFIIIICADFSRTTKRYGDRGIRYVFMEVGHCAQNIHLEAVALNLVSVPIGAFKDKKVKEILKLPENIAPLYIIPIGYPK
ncbi:MAG: SagB/ThcOx family dehydrogenase [Promethearchaeota archaeon]